MATYLIHDARLNERCLVEAPSAAVALQMFNAGQQAVELVRSPSEALRLASQGVRFIGKTEPSPEPAPILEAIEQADPAAKFTEGFDDCDKPRPAEQAPTE